MSQVTLHRLRGEQDFPDMLRVLLASAAADGVERYDTLETFTANYRRLPSAALQEDLVLAQAGDELVGYGRAWCEEQGSGWVYHHNAFLHPDWRRQGIGSRLLSWLETRLRQVAQQHLAAQYAGSTPGVFQAVAEQHAAGARRLLENAGYRPVRDFHEMVRPLQGAIPNWPLPPGLTVRPAQPADYPAIWASVDETSVDEWGYTPPTQEAYQQWLNSPQFQPELWQIAWDGATGRVAGHVLTYIDAQENTAMQRQRGYTEGIGVSPSWRRRGLATALIGLSLRAQQEAGMTESALAVDSHNGSLRLYEHCGFSTVHRQTVYRKPL